MVEISLRSLAKKYLLSISCHASSMEKSPRRCATHRFCNGIQSFASQGGVARFGMVLAERKVPEGRFYEV
jgi:hypothetical protein